RDVLDLFLGLLDRLLFGRSLGLHLFRAGSDIRRFRRRNQRFEIDDDRGAEFAGLADLAAPVRRCDSNDACMRQDDDRAAYEPSAQFARAVIGEESHCAGTCSRPTSATLRYPAWRIRFITS